MFSVTPKLESFCFYTDGQKKRYNRILSGYTRGSQTRAYMTGTLSKASGYLNLSIFVYQACWLIPVYIILTAVINFISF